MACTPHSQLGAIASPAPSPRGLVCAAFSTLHQGGVAFPPWSRLLSPSRPTDGPRPWGGGHERKLGPCSRPHPAAPAETPASGLQHGGPTLGLLAMRPSPSMWGWQTPLCGRGPNHVLPRCPMAPPPMPISRVLTSPRPGPTIALLSCHMGRSPVVSPAAWTGAQFPGPAAPEPLLVRGRRKGRALPPPISLQPQGRSSRGVLCPGFSTDLTPARKPRASAQVLSWSHGTTQGQAHLP